jgi:predicted deacetylase
MKSVCVAIHDVAPQTWPRCERLIAAVERAAGAVPLTLLVVPRYHGDPTLPRWYLRALEDRLARGDELALHGWTHRDEGPPLRGPLDWLRRRVATDREGEFAALAEAEARERLALGRAWFERRGWPLAGFVAPAWLLSAGSRRALGDSGFLYTTTRSSLVLLRPARRFAAPAIGYSARGPLRTALSLAWVPLAAATLASPALVRVALHPVDAGQRAVLGQAGALLARLAREREPLTKRAAALRLDREPARVIPPPSRTTAPRTARPAAPPR